MFHRTLKTAILMQIRKKGLVILCATDNSNMTNMEDAGAVVTVMIIIYYCTIVMLQFVMEKTGIGQK